MSDFLSYIHEFNFCSLTLRLFLAMICGGLIGMGREQKGRAAGFRTYMLTSLGAALTILLSIYEYRMLTTTWDSLIVQETLKFDGSRVAAQVINGIGFLGAGTIITTSHQRIKGLTTASGLWASACMGIAAGAGFYSCIIISLVLILLVMELLPIIEYRITSKSREFSIFAEFHALENISEITASIKSCRAQVTDIEIERRRGNDYYHASALFSVTLDKGNFNHSDLIVALSKLDCIYTVSEVE